MTKMILPVAADSNTASSDIVSSLEDMATYDKAGDAARLKAIYERIVEPRGESRDDFGRRSGIGKAANVSHYLNGKNNLSVESARKFAAAIPCKIEDFSTYWARIAYATGQVATESKPYPPIQGGAPLVARENADNGLPTLHTTSATSVRMPLLSWGRIDLMLELNENLVGTEGVELVDADGEHVGRRTKLIEMPDDSMAPRIQRGDRLTIEPDWTAEPGEIVLLKDKFNVFYVRRIKQVRPGHFIAEPANSQDFHSLDSKADGPLEIIGVVVARREFLAKRKR